jgi:mono/diheme cytochrome c family protein
VVTRAFAACAFALLALHAGASAAWAQAAAPGAEIYAKHCASCHDQTSPRIPPRDALAKLSPARILRTLDFGLMMSVAYPLRRDEREAVAAFLGKGPDDTAPPALAMCKAGRPLRDTSARGAWTAVSVGRAGGADGGDRTATRTEVGFRIPRRRDGVRRTHGDERHAVRRQRRRCGAGDRRAERLHPLDVHGQRSGAFGDDHRH